MKSKLKILLSVVLSFALVIWAFPFMTEAATVSNTCLLSASSSTTSTCQEPYTYWYKVSCAHPYTVQKSCTHSYLARQHSYDTETTTERVQVRTPVYHSHTDSCYTKTTTKCSKWSTHPKCGNKSVFTDVPKTQPGPYGHDHEAKCSTCKKMCYWRDKGVSGSNEGFAIGSSVYPGAESMWHGGKKTEKTLSCGKTTSTIVSYNTSYENKTVTKQVTCTHTYTAYQHANDNYTAYRHPSGDDASETRYNTRTLYNVSCSTAVPDTKGKIKLVATINKTSYGNSLNASYSNAKWSGPSGTFNGTTCEVSKPGTYTFTADVSATYTATKVSTSLNIGQSHVYEVSWDQLASRTKSGVKRFTCKYCGDTYTQNTGALSWKIYIGKKQVKDVYKGQDIFDYGFGSDKLLLQ